jgi:hypothetical protein
MYEVFLTKLTDGKHKYKVQIFAQNGFIAAVKFGASGYGDYTLGTSEDQKKAYIARHQANEDWTKTGYFTAGFWSRWLLWNKRTLQQSIKDIEKRFSDIKIYFIQ